MTAPHPEPSETVRESNSASILWDLFSEAELRHALDARLVVARKHPSSPLTILNYTERCQYERGLWGPVTLACRGLIHDDRGLLLARPFRKFFNYGQDEAPSFDVTDACEATDKLDGSLGILYRANDGWSIATRGAFESDQAKHATALLRSRYASYVPPDGWTVLFEIIYPDNRIVLDYGDRDDLVLLGAVEIATGRSVGPNSAVVASWPGPNADVFAYRTVADALAAPPRANAEGLVLHLIGSDERMKIKQDDYVALHRIVTGLNERTVWEHVAGGRDVAELLNALPDEFHGWVADVAARLHAHVEEQAVEIERAYAAIIAALPDHPTRKDYAMAAKEHPQKGALFSRHDGKDYRPSLWSACYPAARIGPRALAPTEDAA